MGLLRLINASRLAPLEELLAELKSGAPSSASMGTARAGSSVLTQARQATQPPAISPAFATPSKITAQNLAAADGPAGRESNPQFPSAAPQAATSVPAEGKAPNDNKETMRVSGISQEQVAEIKSTIQSQQKFLGELVEHSSGWELEGPELRIYFLPNNKTFAELMEGRDTLEKIRAISSNVLGRAVRVCARLDSVAAAAAAAAGTQELRAQFERDPLVRSMLQRFGGKITEVRSRQEEK
jgi:hypothetical protein